MPCRLGTVLAGLIAAGLFALPARAMDGPSDLNPFTAVNVDNAAAADIALGELNPLLVSVTIHVLGQPSTNQFLPNGPSAHETWRQILGSIAVGTANTGGAVIATQRFSTSSTQSFTLSGGTALVGSAFAQQAVWQTGRFYAQFALGKWFQLRRGYTEQQAKWAAFAVSTFFNLGYSLGVAPYVSSQIVGYVQNPTRRALLSYNSVTDTPAGPVGTRIQQLLQGLDRARIVNQTLVIPPIQGWSTAERYITLPLDRPFNSTSRPSIAMLEYYSPTMNRLVAQVDFMPGAYTMEPVKMFENGTRLWMLTERAAGGLNIYWRNASATPGEEQWRRIPGQVIDLDAGPHALWGMNAAGNIYYCYLPCDTGAWSQFATGNAHRVAVGPGFNSTRTSTVGGPMRVWVRAWDGRYYYRAEDPGIAGGWLPVTAADTPPRIRGLLEERDAMGEFNRQYAAYAY